jgi:hypothetical protein
MSARSLRHLWPLARRLRTTFRYLLNTVVLISLLLAILTLVLSIRTTSRPLRLYHDYQRSGSSAAAGRLQIDFARGGLWYLHLHTFPKGAEPSLTLFPIVWTVLSPEPSWLERLGPAQTGDVHLGFCSHLRHTEGSAIAIDKTTLQHTTVTLVEEQRVTRIPLLALILLLSTLPAIRLAAIIYRRHKRPEPHPGPLRRAPAIAAFVSSLALAFTLWQSTPLGIGMSLKWTTRESNTASGPFADRYAWRHLALNSAGWTFSYESNTPNPDFSQFATHDVAILMPESDVSIPASASISRFLGFQVYRLDTGTRRSVYPTPTFSLYKRRIVKIVTVPQWSLCLLFSLPIAAWIYLVWRPRRRRARRLKLGLCTSCGYDLRSSPNQCPECGAPAPPLLL